MGVLKLTQDLLLYTERAVLGKPCKIDDTGIRVASIVIDGPSFVYFCYQKIAISGKNRGIQPSYAEINIGVVDLLDDLRNHGVEIQKIYFDGALPLIKRETRLNRLEQLRRQHETFWKLHPEGLQICRHVQEQRRSHPSRTQQHQSSRSLIPCAPSFMIPSAIESIRRSCYSSLVEVVSDEADFYCALHSKNTGVAIISNDSDLALYELGEDFVLILLQSLEKVDYESGQSSFMANCVRPQRVAERLRITNLRSFAFERQCDSSASLAVIRRRAQEVARNTLATEAEYFNEFSKLYRIDLTEREKKINSQNLDPRLSELFNQYSGPTHCTSAEKAFYVPMLMEDPSRDSAWSYGQDVRQLAYSLVNLSMAKALQCDSLTEYQRRANRIGAVPIQLLNNTSILNSLNLIVKLITEFPPVSSVEVDIVFAWRLIALHLVDEQKKDRAKTTISLDTLMQLFSVRGEKRLAWCAVHTNASCDAVLYSLRLLKQVMDEVSSTLSLPQLNELRRRLEALPPLAKLMDNHIGKSPTENQVSTLLHSFRRNDI